MIYRCWGSFASPGEGNGLGVEPVRGGGVLVIVSVEYVTVLLFCSPLLTLSLGIILCSAAQGSFFCAR